MQENIKSSTQYITTIKINRHTLLATKSDKMYHTKHIPLNTKIYANANFSIVVEQYSQCGSSTT